MVSAAPGTPAAAVTPASLLGRRKALPAGPGAAAPERGKGGRRRRPAFVPKVCQGLGLGRGLWKGALLCRRGEVQCGGLGGGLPGSLPLWGPCPPGMLQRSPEWQCKALTTRWGREGPDCARLQYTTLHGGVANTYTHNCCPLRLPVVILSRAACMGTGALHHHRTPPRALHRLAPAIITCSPRRP